MSEGLSSTDSFFLANENRVAVQVDVVLQRAAEFTPPSAGVSGYDGHWMPAMLGSSAPTKQKAMLIRINGVCVLPCTVAEPA